MHDNKNTGWNRRTWLRNSALGFGAMACEWLRAQDLAAVNRPSDDLVPRQGHRAPKARAVIQLFQNGGPSQMDLFDPKPELTKRAGEPHPGEVETFQLGNKNVLLPCPFEFSKYGQSGMDFSTPLPHMANMADHWCMIRSMHTENNNHPFAINMMQTGKTFFGYPSMGSWICYALGTENQDLPGYIVLRDPQGYNTSGKMVWSSGWLPAIYQGTEFRSRGNSVHHLYPTHPRVPGAQQCSLELLSQLNRLHLRSHPEESELEARIRNYELAARMQLAARNILDLDSETKETRTRYGLDNPMTENYGSRCLMARRLVESGVRFVQVFPPLKPSFQPWDSHSGLKSGIETISAQVDKPSAALIEDLKTRGLLNEVIVIWTGEFGRLPITENSNGRDHNRHAFTTLVAGGGFRGGFTYGATDPFGYQAVDQRVSVSDFHATVLKQMGLDHEVLSYRYRGRDERLTDPEVTHARVVPALLS